MTDPVGGQAALILVLHHVLADGLGGLAVLAALADPGARTDSNVSATPAAVARTAHSAAREKLRATPATRLRRGLAGLRELGLDSVAPA